MKRWHYWNANWSQTAVVGVVTMVPPKEGDGPDEPFDWAAYIGGTTGAEVPEKDTVDFVSRRGCKLSREQACAFFPQFATIPYRD